MENNDKISIGHRVVFQIEGEVIYQGSNPGAKYDSDAMLLNVAESKVRAFLLPRKVCIACEKKFDIPSALQSAKSAMQNTRSDRVAMHGPFPVNDHRQNDQSVQLEKGGVPIAPSAPETVCKNDRLSPQVASPESPSCTKKDQNDRKNDHRVAGKGPSSPGNGLKSPNSASCTSCTDDRKNDHRVATPRGTIPDLVGASSSKVLDRTDEVVIKLLTVGTRGKSPVNQQGLCKAFRKPKWFVSRLIGWYKTNGYITEVSRGVYSASPIFSFSKPPSKGGYKIPVHCHRVKLTVSPGFQAQFDRYRSTLPRKGNPKGWAKTILDDKHLGGIGQKLFKRQNFNVIVNVYCCEYSAWGYGNDPDESARIATENAFKVKNVLEQLFQVPFGIEFRDQPAQASDTDLAKDSHYNLSWDDDEGSTIGASIENSGEVITDSTPAVARTTIHGATIRVDNSPEGPDGLEVTGKQNARTLQRIKEDLESVPQLQQDALDMQGQIIQIQGENHGMHQEVMDKLDQLIASTRSSAEFMKNQAQIDGMLFEKINALGAGIAALTTRIGELLSAPALNNNLPKDVPSQGGGMVI